MSTGVLLIILICVGISYLVSNYRKRLPLIKAAEALPGPKTLPIIGNAHYFLQKNVDDTLNGLYSLADTYPSPFRFWLGSKLFIIVYEPDHVQTILRSQSCLNKNLLYDLGKAWLGNGLFTAPASIWIKHRKIIASSFNSTILRKFCDTFAEQASIFMDKLGQMTGREINLYDDIAICTLDIINITSLGINLELQSNKNNQYVKALLRLKEIVLRRARNIFLFYDVIFNLTSLRREEKYHLDCIHSSADKVMQQKKNARNNTEFIEETQRKNETGNGIFLDTLMEASNEGKFTQQDIHDEINTICVAGSDTTADTINFLVFMLGNFPEVQEKAYKELLDIYGTQDPKTAPVKFEDLQYMNYLECVIKETLRLFPILPLLGRHIDKDIEIGRHTLPKGTDVVILPIFMHRSEKYWKNALKFNPDRFLPENMSNIHPYGYIPFSNGPRNCIGIKFAMTSIKVIIATLLRTYIIEVNRKVEIDEIKLKMNVLLAPYEPLKVRLQNRF